MPKKRRPQKSKSGKSRLPISGHKRVGKIFSHPILDVPNLKMASWIHDRSPEMIWAALIIAKAAKHEYAIAELRRILKFIEEAPDREEFHDLTLTGIAKLAPERSERVIKHMLQSAISRRALCSLKFFTTLPARHQWVEILPDDEPDLVLLMNAIGIVLWHQSQEATDCRWVKSMASILAGKTHLLQAHVQEWLQYPDFGDQRGVRPMIRAHEGAHASLLTESDLDWPRSFWEEGFEGTPCLEMSGETSPKIDYAQVYTRLHITDVLNGLEIHWRNTCATTGVDAKHDAVFGLAFYCLRLFDELLNIGNGTGVVGRLVLRTLLEVRITLRFLLSSTDDEIWKKWRAYGAGQAKLNVLKFDYDLEVPSYISVDSIEKIAGEDIWEEYVSMDVGHWAGVDLRKMSELVELKELYDQYYSWPSGFIHGSWGAVREACFKTCINPLHRLHRYPERELLSDAVKDAASLINNVLDELEIAYPGFPVRLKGEL